MASVWRGSLTARIYSKSLKTTLEIGFIQTKQETKEILCVVHGLSNQKIVWANVRNE
jgi:hypothetical protein